MLNAIATRCGLTVHSSCKTLCTNTKVIRTILSPVFFSQKKHKVVPALNTHCTQPIHCQNFDFSSVNLDLYTLSTGPITTTNIYKG